MGNYNFNFDDNGGGVSSISGNLAGTNVQIQPLMRMIYLWMTIGLALTGGIATAVATVALNGNEQIVQTLYSLSLPLIIVQFGIVIGLGWAIGRISANVARILFLVYASTMGLSLGVIFFAYIAMGDGFAIAKAFFITAGLFGVMSVVGYTTKVDLSKYSSFFMMALIGLVIAMVVNIFLNSSAIDYIISVAGVLIFTALTAWDTQRFKNMAALPEYQQYSDNMRKLAVMGALTLYLDFLNIFLFLLQLFSGRD